MYQVVYWNWITKQYSTLKNKTSVPVGSTIKGLKNWIEWMRSGDYS